jgi:putative spermidine/putrescine transport system permease protein
MAAFPPYVGLPGRVWYYGLRLVCGVILLFLLLPVLVIMPLSFNSEPYFTYPMPGLSVRWYREFLTSDVWLLALKNSLIVGGCATLSATALGTLAALGLSRPGLRYKTAIMGLLISPMVVPLVITAVGMYFLYAPLGLSNSLLGLIVAHTALGTPFVVTP